MEQDKNIDDIIDNLGNPENDDPNPEPNEEEEVKQEPDGEQNPEPQTEDPKVDDPSEGGEDNEDPKPKSNNVIRTLRENVKNTNKQVKEYEAMIEKIAKQQGISKDELVNKLQQEADEKEAKEKNISPEIQRQLREQKEALDDLRQERQREVFNNKFNKLTEEYPMDDAQAREFVKNAIDKGIDLGNPNTDFEAVYIALNYKDILAKAKRETEQEVLARIEKQKKNAPDRTSRIGQGDGVRKDNLNDVLKDIGLSD